MIEESDKPAYNGWIVFLLVIAVLFSEDWLFIGAILLCVIYVGWIEYLKMKYNLALKEAIFKKRK